MRWPWQRQHPIDDAATVAADKARAQLSDARQQRPKVANAERAARVLARQHDALAREVERTLHRRHA